MEKSWLEEHQEKFKEDLRKTYSTNLKEDFKSYG